jgi:hypothetical protein
LRRLAIVLAAAVVVLAGCASSSVARPRLWVAPAPATHRLTGCASVDCGGQQVTLQWSGVNIASQTGYLVFVNGAQVSDQTTAGYTLYGLDCGVTTVLGVEAHNGTGGTSSMYSYDYTTPSCPGNVLSYQNKYLAGTEIGVWETNGGAALSNTNNVLSQFQALNPAIIRYGVYDCWTTETCGTDSHTGSQSESTFETTMSNMHTDFPSAVPWIKLPPVTSGAIGSVAAGSVFCPPVDASPNNTIGTNWSMNLSMDEQIVQAISTVYTGPLILEDDNEAEYDCWSAWHFAGAGSTGVSKNIAQMYAATMPALKAYALSLGFSQVVTVGYIGVGGGLGWGSTCSAGGGTYGYTCTVSNKWIDEFNNQLESQWAADSNSDPNKPYYIPDVESLHSYCHSPDFVASNPYVLADAECDAYYNQWIQNARTEANSIWGSTIGNGIRFSVSEWQGGICTNTSTACWSGFPTDEGSYIDNFLSMLQGNGETTGSNSTAFWEGTLFEVASNTDSAAAGAYNVINIAGTTPSWYTNVKTDFNNLNR